LPVGDAAWREVRRVSLFSSGPALAKLAERFSARLPAPATLGLAQDASLAAMCGAPRSAVTLTIVTLFCRASGYGNCRGNVFADLYALVVAAA